MKKLTLTVAALVTLISANAAAWEPFTAVTNVCASCQQEPADVVTLTNGTKIRGTVVGENAKFWVVVRFTEARAIPKGEVQGIEWANKSKPSSVTTSDQVLLKNGVVLAGTIIEDKAKPPVFQIKSAYLNQTYVVFKAEVAEAYKSGVKVDLGN